MAALKLQYCRTFIDAQEGAATVPQLRACSAPPCLGRQSAAWDTDAQLEEEGLKAYVSSLTTNVADLRSQIDVSRSSQHDSGHGSPGTGTRDVIADFPSQGSMGHPDLCHRPCIYFASGHCENGRSCGYCHMEHRERPMKLDKQQRAMVHGLSKPQVLAMMLRYLQPAAVKQGFELQATELVGIVERELSLCGQAADKALADIPDKVTKKLSKTLDRMRFSAIVGLASQEQIGSDLRQQMMDAMERLRAAVPTSDPTGKM